MPVLTSVAAVCLAAFCVDIIRVSPLWCLDGIGNIETVPGTVSVAATYIAPRVMDKDVSAPVVVNEGLAPHTSS